MTGGSFINDHRDDPLDATRGSYSLVNFGVAWKDFGSQSDFVRFNGKNSTYYSFGSHLVFARLTQFGVVTPFGGLYSITVPASNGQPAQVDRNKFHPSAGTLLHGGQPIHARLLH